MPHNNRVSSSGALQTNDIWSKTIGFDPYASSDSKATLAEEAASQEQAAGLMLLAKMSNFAGTESRGSCKKCGMLGHLTFQCRNTIKLKNSFQESSSDSSSDSEADIAPKAKTQKLEPRDDYSPDRRRDREIGSEKKNEEVPERRRDSRDSRDGYKEAPAPSQSGKCKSASEKKSKKEKSEKNEKRKKDKKSKSKKEKSEKREK